MFCGHCGAKNAPGNRFCHSCGQALTPVCAQCGHEVGEEDRFCPNCGHPVDEAAPSAPATAPSAPPAYSAPAAPPSAPPPPPANWGATSAGYVAPAVPPAYPPPPAATQGYIAEPAITGYAPSYAPARPAMDYQGVGRRFWATLIDGVIFSIPMYLFGGGTAMIGAMQGNTYGAQFSTGSTLVLLAVMVAWVIFEAYGGTPGKRILGMRIVNAEGENIGIGRSIVRNLLRVIDAIPGIIPYGLGAILVASSDTKQRLGDRAAGSYVIRR